jgi:hypothetical protein
MIAAAAQPAALVGSILLFLDCVALRYSIVCVLALDGCCTAIG